MWLVIASVLYVIGIIVLGMDDWNRKPHWLASLSWGLVVGGGFLTGAAWAAT